MGKMSHHEGSNLITLATGEASYYIKDIADDLQSPQQHRTQLPERAAQPLSPITQP